MRRFLTALCAFTLVAAGTLFLGSAAMAAGKGQPTVAICHHGTDDITGEPTIEIITVSNQAVQSHINNHGDNVVGPEVCGDGVDNDCNGMVDDPAVCDCPCWAVSDLNNVTAENQLDRFSCNTYPPSAGVVIQNIRGSTPDVQGGFAALYGDGSPFCATRDPNEVDVPVTPEQFQICADQIRARCAEIGTPIP